MALFYMIFQFPSRLCTPISYNVPAVGDVFATRIRALRRKTRAAKMWVEAGVGMERSGMT
jgi:hypothetical protein